MRPLASEPHSAVRPLLSRPGAAEPFMCNGASQCHKEAGCSRHGSCLPLRKSYLAGFPAVPVRGRDGACLQDCPADVGT